MEILINNEARQFAGPVTIAELLEILGLVGRRVAVEVNRDIVPKSHHPMFVLEGGEKVEIVHAIGGG